MAVLVPVFSGTFWALTEVQTEVATEGLDMFILNAANTAPILKASTRMLQFCANM